MFFASSPSTFSETGSALTYASIFMKPALRLAHLRLPKKVAVRFERLGHRAIVKCLHPDHAPSAAERENACKLFNAFRSSTL